MQVPGLTTKKRSLVRAGWAAALIAAIPGLSIGVGGRPLWMRVLYGEGLASMSVADRATIANMAPEYGATMGFFPVDEQTLNYLRLTGRDPKHVDLVERYCKEQGLWRQKNSEPNFMEVLSLDMGTVMPSVAGPRRPQDRVELRGLKTTFQSALVDVYKKSVGESATPRLDRWSAEGVSYKGDDEKSAATTEHIKGDEKSIDMNYWYGRALEAKGDAASAIKAYSQVAQMNFNYRDVQVRIKKLRAAAGGAAAST